MSSWQKKGKKVLASVLALLVLASASLWAWPSQLYGKESYQLSQAVPSEELQRQKAEEDAGIQEQTSVEAAQVPATSEDTSAPSTEAASTELQRLYSNLSEEEQAAVLLLKENPAALEALLRELQGDRAYEKIAPYVDIMISEYNDVCNRHDALTAEYNALAKEHADVVDGLPGQLRFTLIPEVSYDFTKDEWGLGASIGLNWSHVAIMAGVEKALNRNFFTTEGWKVRAGVGLTF